MYHLLSLTSSLMGQMHLLSLMAGMYLHSLLGEIDLHHRETLQGCQPMLRPPFRLLNMRIRDKGLTTDRATQLRKLGLSQ